MQERGYLPKNSIKERGEEKDKVSDFPQNYSIRKKCFREISITDIMPSFKERLSNKQILTIMPKNSNGFISFSKQFSHFVISSTFLSYLEVSDYLELRKGCKYLWDCYEYSILEELIKMDNLDNYLRLNLWLTVTPYHRNQSKWREILQEIETEDLLKSSDIFENDLKKHYETKRCLDLGSVFDNAYIKVLEKSESLDYLVSKIEFCVREFKNGKLNNSLYEAEDFEVLKNLALCNSFLFPENF